MASQWYLAKTPSGNILFAQANIPQGSQTVSLGTNQADVLANLQGAMQKLGANAVQSTTLAKASDTGFIASLTRGSVSPTGQITPTGATAVAQAAEGTGSAQGGVSATLGISTPTGLNGLGGIFSGISGAITDTVDFLKLIAWIFHPRNLLRAVEFMTGLVLMLFGVYVALKGGSRGSGMSSGSNGETVYPVTGNGLNRVARSLADDAGKAAAL